MGIFFLIIIVDFIVIYFYVRKYKKFLKYCKRYNYFKRNKTIIKANSEFEKVLSSKTKYNSGAVTNYLSVDFFKSFLLNEKSNSNDTKIASVIKFIPKFQLTDDEAELAGDIIKKEFNGSIISACSKQNKESNFYYYVYLAEISKDDSIMFVLTTKERIENQIRKVFEIETYNLNELSTIQIENEIV